MTWASGIVVTTSGLGKEDKQRVQQCIKRAGGDYSPNLSKRCTHILTRDGARSEKLDAVRGNPQAWPQAVVRLDWLAACERNSMRLDPEAYALQQRGTEARRPFGNLQQPTTTRNQTASYGAGGAVTARGNSGGAAGGAPKANLQVTGGRPPALASTPWILNHHATIKDEPLTSEAKPPGPWNAPQPLQAAPPPDLPAPVSTAHKPAPWRVHFSQVEEDPLAFPVPVPAQAAAEAAVRRPWRVRVSSVPEDGPASPPAGCAAAAATAEDGPQPPQQEVDALDGEDVLDGTLLPGGGRAMPLAKPWHVRHVELSAEDDITQQLKATAAGRAGVEAPYIAPEDGSEAQDGPFPPVIPVAKNGRINPGPAGLHDPVGPDWSADRPAALRHPAAVAMMDVLASPRSSQGSALSDAAAAAAGAALPGRQAGARLQGPVRLEELAPNRPGTALPNGHARVLPPMDGGAPAAGFVQEEEEPFEPSFTQLAADLQALRQNFGTPADLVEQPHERDSSIPAAAPAGTYSSDTDPAEGLPSAGLTGAFRPRDGRSPAQAVSPLWQAYGKGPAGALGWEGAPGRQALQPPEAEAGRSALLDAKPAPAARPLGASPFGRPNPWQPREGMSSHANSGAEDAAEPPAMSGYWRQGPLPDAAAESPAGLEPHGAEPQARGHAPVASACGRPWHAVDDNCDEREGPGPMTQLMEGLREARQGLQYGHADTRPAACPPRSPYPWEAPGQTASAAAPLGATHGPTLAEQWGLTSALDEGPTARQAKVEAVPWHRVGVLGPADGAGFQPLDQSEAGQWEAVGQGGGQWQEEVQQGASPIGPSLSQLVEGLRQAREGLNCRSSGAVEQRDQAVGLAISPPGAARTPLADDASPRVPPPPQPYWPPAGAKDGSDSVHTAVGASEEEQHSPAVAAADTALQPAQDDISFSQLVQLLQKQKIGRDTGGAGQQCTGTTTPGESTAADDFSGECDAGGGFHTRQPHVGSRAESSARVPFRMTSAGAESSVDHHPVPSPSSPGGSDGTVDPGWSPKAPSDVLRTMPAPHGQVPQALPASEDTRCRSGASHSSGQGHMDWEFGEAAAASPLANASGRVAGEAAFTLFPTAEPLLGPTTNGRGQPQNVASLEEADLPPPQSVGAQPDGTTAPDTTPMPAGGLGSRSMGTEPEASAAPQGAHDVPAPDSKSPELRPTALLSRFEPLSPQGPPHELCSVGGGLDPHHRTLSPGVPSELVGRRASVVVGAQHAGDCPQHHEAEEELEQSAAEAAGGLQTPQAQAFSFDVGGGSGGGSGQRSGAGGGSLSFKHAARKLDSRTPVLLCTQGKHKRREQRATPASMKGPLPPQTCGSPRSGAQQAPCPAGPPREDSEGPQDTPRRQSTGPAAQPAFRGFQQHHSQRDPEAWSKALAARAPQLPVHEQPESQSLSTLLSSQLTASQLAPVPALRPEEIMQRRSQMPWARLPGPSQPGQHTQQLYLEAPGSSGPQAKAGVLSGSLRGACSVRTPLAAAGGARGFDLAGAMAVTPLHSTPWRECGVGSDEDEALDLEAIVAAGRAAAAAKVASQQMPMPVPMPVPMPMGEPRAPDVGKHGQEQSCQLPHSPRETTPVAGNAADGEAQTRASQADAVDASEGQCHRGGHHTGRVTAGHVAAAAMLPLPQSQAPEPAPSLDFQTSQNAARTPPFLSPAEQVLEGGEAAPVARQSSHEEVVAQATAAFGSLGLDGGGLGGCHCEESSLLLETGVVVRTSPSQRLADGRPGEHGVGSVNDSSGVGGLLAGAAVIIDRSLTDHQAAACATAVEALGGHISAVSHLGCGATAVVCNPSRAGRWLAWGAHLMSPRCVKKLAGYSPTDDGAAAPDTASNLLCFSRGVVHALQGLVADAHPDMEGDDHGSGQPAALSGGAPGAAGGTAAGGPQQGTRSDPWATRALRRQFLLDLKAAETASGTRLQGLGLGGDHFGAKPAPPAPLALLEHVVWAVTEPLASAQTTAPAPMYVSGSEPGTDAAPGKTACKTEDHGSWALGPCFGAAPMSQQEVQDECEPRPMTQEDLNAVAYSGPRLTLVMPLDEHGVLGHHALTLQGAPHLRAPARSGGGVALPGCGSGGTGITVRDVLEAIGGFYAQVMAPEEMAAAMASHPVLRRTLQVAWQTLEQVPRSALLGQKLALCGLRRCSASGAAAVYELQLAG